MGSRTFTNGDEVQLFSIRSRMPYDSFTYTFVTGIDDDGNLHTSTDQFEATRLTESEWSLLCETTGTKFMDHEWTRYPSLDDKALSMEADKRGRK